MFEDEPRPGGLPAVVRSSALQCSSCGNSSRRDGRKTVIDRYTEVCLI